jgi:hypothetical protein
MEDLLQILHAQELGVETIVFPDPTFPEPMAIFQKGSVRIWSLEKVERWKALKGL